MVFGGWRIRAAIWHVGCATWVERLTGRFPLFCVDTEVRHLHNQFVELAWLRVPGLVMAMGNRNENDLDAMVQSIAEHLKSLPAEERQTRIKAFVSRRSSKLQPASKTLIPRNETVRSLKVSPGRKLAHVCGIRVG